MGSLNTKLMFSSAIDTWSTPRDYFDKVNAEFNFGLDAAALQNSTLVPDNWFGPDHPDEDRRDALSVIWRFASPNKPIWLNPPYGRVIGKWMAKAANEARGGAEVVCLVPARTDTKWWHESVIQHEVRFIRGRLKFGGQKNSAPFPSALVVMRG